MASSDVTGKWTRYPDTYRAWMPLRRAKMVKAVAKWTQYPSRSPSRK